MSRLERVISYGKGFRSQRELSTDYTPKPKERTVTLTSAERQRLHTVLDPLIADQKALIEKGAFTRFQGIGKGTGVGEKLLETFVESPFFKDVYTKAVSEGADAQAGLVEAEYRKLLAGNVFETLGSAYMTAQQAQKGRILLPPESVHEIYHTYLYPTEPVTHHPFGVAVVQRHGQPDGIVVSEKSEEIVGAMEYTLSGQKGKFRRQHRRFATVKEREILFPEESQLTFVVPHGTAVRPIEADCKFGYIPIGREQFREFTDWVYGEYKPHPDSATLKDVCDFARQQQQKEVVRTYTATKNS